METVRDFILGGSKITAAGDCSHEIKRRYFCFIDYAKAFDCVDHNKLWKILKEMGTDLFPVASSIPGS